MTEIKKMGMRKRWLTKTLSIICLLGIVCVLAVTAAFAAYYYSAAEKEIKERARNTVDFFASYQSQNHGDYYQSCVNYASTFEDGDEIEVQFLDTDGTLAASSASQRVALPATTDEIGKAITGGDISSYLGKNPATGEWILAVSAPMVYGDGELIGVMRYVSPMKLVNRQILSVGLISLAVLLLVLIVVVVISHFFLRSIMTPLAEITEKATRIANGSYGVQIQSRYRDEIGELAQTINELSAKISQNERMQAEFISQLSHELRTPLTVINGWRDRKSVV